MNYTELVAAIRAYTENDFPDTAGTGGLSSTEQINTFIRQAEKRVFNEVQLLELRKNVTGSLTTGNKYLSVPSDWQATFSLAVIDGNGRYTYLLNKDVNFIREAYPNPNVTGEPVYYASFDDDSFIVAPTPDSDYTAELHYFFYPESIVTASTSWLGDNYDSVLLYGSLLEAHAYMKGEQDTYAVYKERYDAAMAALKELAEGKNRQDMYRTAQVRYPVR